MSDDELRDRNVVITGASSGLGRGTAIRLAERGARVVIAARRGDVLKNVAAQIRAAGGEALAVPVDVSEADQVERLAAEAEERFGAIDVWVNNVGIGAIGLFWEIPPEDHARVVAVNLTGAINGTHVALRRFVARGRGTVVNLGSIDSETPLAYQASYAATKAAVLSLGRSLTQELRLVGADDVQVATILPFAVDTPWWDHAANHSGHEPRMAAMDDPWEVVDAIVDACADPRGERHVGAKSAGDALVHHLLPRAAERISAEVSQREVRRGARRPRTSGSIHAPSGRGTSVEGGIRERRAREDAGREDEGERTPTAGD
ncbi:MAG: SDR family NAD(P)-dependent oxidoreductase [Actinomycetales bacterium]|nr:SDR family NAD(P)-dependent oxidoreductase [Actinomycetales bacterium]